MPYGGTADADGNVYVPDTYNSTIRKVTPTGVVATIAGLAGNPGSQDGTGSAARFSLPCGTAVDRSGNVYVADSDNNTVRKITPMGVVTTLAGLAGNSGSADGTGSAARFNFPWGIAVDGSGNIYVADLVNNTIRKVTPTGDVTTLAGLAGNSGSADGTGSAARFHSPRGLAVDGMGNVYVADCDNNTIRKVTPAGVVTTLAGLAGSFGSADGTGNVARFSFPWGVAVDNAGNVYVADYSNFAIRKVTSEGVVTTIAGLAGSQGSADGTGAAARFYAPGSLGVDRATNVYVVDTASYTVRKVTPAGVVTTLAGLPVFRNADRDGTGGTAWFMDPTGLALDGAENVYVSDSVDHTIRKVTPAGVVTTLAGSAGNRGSVDGTGSAARFNGPACLVVDSAGNVFVADSTNNTIRKVTSSGVVTTVAGLAGTNGSADGTGNVARFYLPEGIAMDTSGNLFVTDTGNHTIRKVTPTGAVTTVAGLAGARGSTDGTGSAARFAFPWGVATDRAGNLYVADLGNSAIRKVTSSGEVTTLAGLAGNPGSADGTGNAAQFYHPWGVEVDSEGNVYVTDSWNDAIRRVTAAGIVTTVAGLAGNPGSPDGTASLARFATPEGLAIDSHGSLYVADAGGPTIRKGLPSQSISAPVFNQPKISATEFGFGISGIAGLAVEIESSDDLSQWEFVGTYVLQGGTNSVVAPTPPQGARFYRGHVR